MSDDNKFYLILTAIIGITIVASIGVASHYYTERMKAAVAAGYVEGTVPGQSQLCWIKAK